MINRLIMLFVVAMTLFASATAHSKIVSRWENGLDVTIGLDPEQLVVGQPLWLKITITNEAGLKMEDASVSFRFAEGGDIKVMIKKPQELPIRFDAGQSAAMYAKEKMTLEKGRRIARDLMIFYDSKAPSGLVFDKPGFYSINASVTVTFPTSGQVLTAETGWTNIKVVSPSVGEKQALDKLANKEVVFALQNGGTDETSGVLEAMTDYLETYPNGPMAPAVTFTLMNSLCQVPPRNLKRAMNTGIDLLLKWPKSNYTEDVLFTLSYISYEMGDKDLARAWFFYLLDTTPGYRMINRDQLLSYELFFGPAITGEKRRWYQYDKPWDYKAPPQATTSGGNNSDVQ